MKRKSVLGLILLLLASPCFASHFEEFLGTWDVQRIQGDTTREFVWVVTFATDEATTGWHAKGYAYEPSCFSDPGETDTYYIGIDPEKSEMWTMYGDYRDHWKYNLCRIRI